MEKPPGEMGDQVIGADMCAELFEQREAQLPIRLDREELTHDYFLQTVSSVGPVYDTSLQIAVENGPIWDGRVAGVPPIEIIP